MKEVSDMSISRKVVLLVSALSACMLLFVAPVFAAKEEVVIKVGTIVSENHPDYICMRDVFKKNLEKKSGGRIKVELYPNAQLGGDREMSESVQMGTLQIALPATSAIAGFDKRFQVLDLPFLFKDKKTAFKALDGELGNKLDANLTPQGFINLGYFENGFRHVTNNRGPITKPEDLKGLKLRTMENPLHIAFFKLLGANPTPINYGELYTALQQKTVDGEENPIAIVYDAKFYEVQKFYSLTGHVFSATMALMNKSFFDKLPKDLQKLVRDEGRAFVLAQRKMLDANESKQLEELKQKGMKVNTLTPDQKKAFVKATAPVYDTFRDKIGADLVDLAKKIANQ
jgi:tripartite ATP-independent transporter DctP family solute receptor